MQLQSFDAETIEAVWRKALEIPGLPATIWRRDRYGTTIRRFDYGRTDSDFGWVVTRVPASCGIGMATERFQPLQWRNAVPRTFETR